MTSSLPLAPVADVSGIALMAHCQEFARRVKLSGTAEELASFHYLRDQLDGWGFRTRLISHDAFISLPGPAAVTVDGQALRAITHSFSRPTGDDGLTAELVDCGDGSEAAFAAQDLRGRIVLLDGIANPVAADRASRAGAAGQLHVSPHEHLHEMCISPVWGSPGRDGQAQLPRTVACTISDADGAALRDRLRRSEALQVTLRAEVDTGWRQTPILQADLAPEGEEPGGAFVLLSGHHDTWYFGVMDNGSANATMLECARLLAQHRDGWKRGLRLCFWSGHSHGRYSSSAWYADNHWDELERRCAVHVNVDSTGGVGATVLTDSGAAAELNGLAADVIRAETGQEHRGKRGSRSSDMSFWGVGIPSMFGSLSHQPPAPAGARMRNALGWWWHTPEDLLDKVDEANLVRDTRVFLRTLWRLLTDPVLPLDFAAHARALLTELETLRGLDPALLDPLLEEAAALRDQAAALAGSGADPARVNRALMQISRVMVPMDYTAGDRFTHDAALPQPPWPVLQPLRDLAGASGDAARFAAVDAARARNRMLHALRQAGRALGAALA